MSSGINILLFVLGGILVFVWGYRRGKGHWLIRVHYGAFYLALWGIFYIAVLGALRWIRQ